jgi:hypothetical protein
MSAPITVDLWPKDISVSDLVSPVTVLKEQAALLGTKTKNLVEGKVELSESGGNQFVYVFYLVAPALKNYRYRLLSVAYPVEFFPATINFEANNKGGYIAKDYDEFVKKLGEVLSHEKTKAVVKALISQSQE